MELNSCALDSSVWRVSDNLAAWYYVEASRALPEGAVVSARLGTRDIVLYRAEGKVCALDPHCAHMGARLAGGKVEGAELVCPLHGWRYRGDGRVAGGKACVRSWPVVERFGAVLVFNGREPLFPPPEPLPQFHWNASPSTVVPAPWYALTANAFDTHHYEAVHRRRLHEPAQVDQADAFRFGCSYRSYATGSEISDRAMNWLSGRDIRVRMECFGGPLFLVRSQLGRRQSALLVGMEALPDGATKLRLSVGGPSRGPASLLARYLYLTFLKRDLEPMTGIRLQPFTGLAVDAIMEQFAHYLEGLPEANP